MPLKKTICVLAEGAKKTMCGRDLQENEFFAFNPDLATCPICRKEIR